MKSHFSESDTDTIKPVATFRQRMLLWSSWIIFTIGIVVLMGIAGIYVVKNPEMTISISGFVDQYFWLFTVIRWCLYCLLLLSWHRIATWYGTAADGQPNEQLIASVLSWRWSFFRILVVYELLFPFDLMLQVGKLL